MEEVQAEVGSGLLDLSAGSKSKNRRSRPIPRSKADVGAHYGLASFSSGTTLTRVLSLMSLQRIMGQLVECPDIHARHPLAEGDRVIPKLKRRIKVVDAVGFGVGE